MKAISRLSLSHQFVGMTLAMVSLVILALALALALFVSSYTYRMSLDQVVQITHLLQPTDFFQCNEDDSMVNVSVLTNDFDPDGTALQVSSMLVSPPLNGVLTINTNGTFSYFPTTNYFGPDSFSYKVCDGGVPNYCDTAVVVLTISPINDAPSAVDDYFILSANSALQGNVLFNDSDLESDSLIVSGIIQSGSLNGNLMLQPNGALSYTPDPNFAGVTALSYIVCNYVP